jgi:hypothetical protein
LSKDSENQKVCQQLKQVYDKEKAKLPQVPEKYQEVCNLQYVRYAEARDELMEIIEELWKIDGLVLAKTGGHDLSVRYKGRQIVKICPLSKAWSASIMGGGIQRYTKEQVLDSVRHSMAENKSSVSPDGDELIQRLEDRIKKLSPRSKGISLKGLNVTKKVEGWIMENGYSLHGSTLLVK